jgi:Flp pilus assembly protein TadG
MAMVEPKNGWQGRLRAQRGVALVELAFVLPILMILLLGMLDFGKAFHVQIDETHLANEGARLAAVNFSVAGCTQANTNICLAQYIQESADIGELRTGRTGDASSAPNQDAAEVCIFYPTNDFTTTRGNIGDPVQVTVSVDYAWLRYVSGRLNIGPTTPITGKASMRLERPAPALGLSAPGHRTCNP